jgi:tetratricopeptide (TPR) repeat protein
VTARTRRAWLAATACGLVLFFGFAPSAAQSPGRGSPPSLAEFIRRPIELQDHIGLAHEAVTTTDPRAQAYFDQGLAYLHSFVWLDAARSFNEALRADPGLAMGRLGLSYALGELGFAAEARSAAREAERLAVPASRREQLRIDIRLRQLAADDRPGDTAARDAYTRILAESLSSYPSDVEFLLLVGQAQEPPMSTHGVSHESRSVVYYEKALEQAPGYFAVHHYLAHAYENMNQFDLAEPHARRYAADASRVPHAHHMLGHVLRRTARVDEALGEFESADRLEREYARDNGVPPEFDWHYRHNLNLLGMSYQYVGRLNAAAAALRRSFELEPADELSRRDWPTLLLAQSRFAEAADAGRQLAASGSPAVRALGHLFISRALQSTDQLNAAAAQGNEALREMRAAGTVGGTLLPAFELVQGEFLLRTERRAEGRAMLLDAATKLGAETGPDAWTETLFDLEHAAARARDLSEWDLAGDLAKAMRSQAESYGGTAYALGRVAENRGQTAEAVRHYRDAVDSWHEGDADFGGLVDARRRLSALASPAPPR